MILVYIQITGGEINDKISPFCFVVLLHERINTDYILRNRNNTTII